jgi:hypothetical protein
MAITPNVDFVSGAILTAAQQNQFPRGAMGQVTRTSGGTVLTTTVGDITGLSITFTAVTGRLYKATWSFSAQKTLASYTTISFATSANVQVAALDISAADAGYFSGAGTALFTASSGSVTYKMRGLTGLGTAATTASATQPSFFMIEDIGLA